jgi:4-hydroxy-4-methyl-2-oxoglutarate aldolase
LPQPELSPSDPALAASLSRRLEALDTCVLSDVLDSLGLSGVLHGMSPLWDCGRVAGPIRTMRLRRLNVDEVPPASTVHLGARAIERSVPGDVIVVAHQGRSDSAGWGGLLSAAAAVRKVRAVVVDGACRDVEEAEQFGLPVFARSSTPVSARGRTVEVEVDEPITVMGQTIAPGDFIVVDRNGAVVLAADRVTEVLTLAEQMSGREQAMQASIASGVPVSQVMDHRYESMTRTGSPD